jgi:uncharacterized membrane protein YbhN (UPF0104 family)
LKKIQSIAINIFKIVLTLGLFGFVFTKIPINTVFYVIVEANYGFLFIGFVLFVVSQYISTYRLQLHLYTSGFFLKTISNQIVYLIGMFYNFFLPGGIGGDAYKIYLLNKEFKWKLKTIASVLLTDRISGLIAIICLILALGSDLFCYQYIGYFGGFIVVILFIIIVKIIMSKLFKTYNLIFYKSLLFSFVIQLLQVFSILFILKALHQHNFYEEYALIFLISTVLGIFSFAGVGVREYVFFYATTLLPINADISISVGLLFTVFTAILSLFGITPALTKPKLFTI